MTDTLLPFVGRSHASVYTEVEERIVTATFTEALRCELLETRRTLGKDLFGLLRGGLKIKEGIRANATPASKTNKLFRSKAFSLVVVAVACGPCAREVGHVEEVAGIPTVDKDLLLLGEHL